ncbi:MAG: hypothetical protein N2555_03165 [Endomicrobia bacterium]|nr:hypothetical protein [Endomicrobiia bacterium]
MFIIFWFLFFFSYIYVFGTTYHDVTSKNTSFVASIAVNNDVNTIWSNPSNIAHIDYLQLSFTYGLPLFGLKGSEYLAQIDSTNYEPFITENIFSVGMPLKKFGYAGVGVYRLSLERFFNNSLFFISYGKNITKKFLLGCGIKILHREYGKDIYTEYYEVFRTKGYSKTAFTVDFALTYKFLENINTALVLHNLTQPNLSLSNAKEDKYPLTARAGLGVNIHKYKFGIEASYELLTEITRNTKFFSSIEYNLLDKLELSSSLGIGDNNYYDFSFGFRINLLKGILINYAIKYPLSGIKNVLTHKAGVDLLFAPYKKREMMIIQQEVETQEQKVVTPQQQQKSKTKLRSSVIKKLRKFFQDKNEQK